MLKLLDNRPQLKDKANTYVNKSIFSKNVEEFNVDCNLDKKTLEQEKQYIMNDYYNTYIGPFVYSNYSPYKYKKKN